MGIERQLAMEIDGRVIPVTTASNARDLPATALHQTLLGLAGAVLLLASAAGPLGAQSATPADTTPVRHPAHPHKKAPHPAAEAAQAAPEPAVPAAPEPPKWPAFDHPKEASVVWDSHGLTIDAANSSLKQILSDVSTATGVRVDGMNADQRVFGNFGPGEARDVLSQLLQGSGYNVIMIGEQSKGAPRQILLSLQRGGTAQPAARNVPQTTGDSPASDDDEPDEPPVPQQEPMQRPNFQPGASPRNPQQILQEMQQRQQQQQQPQPQE